MIRVPNPGRLDLIGSVVLAAWTLLAVRAQATGGNSLAALLGASGVAWGGLWLAYRRIETIPSSSSVGRRTLGRIVFWGLLFRLVAFSSPPILEDDWQRYLWDGYRFAEVGTPYGSSPMESFDDPAVPQAMVSVLDGINNPDLPTVYGPLAQYAFLVSYLAAPASVAPLRLLLLLAELAVCLLLWRRTGSAATCLLWFWCPLLVFESAFNVHPEALGLLPLVAALGVRSTGRAGRRASEAWRAILTACAAAARPFGMILAPLVIDWRRPSICALFAGTLAALYAPVLLLGGGEGLSLAAMARGWEFNSSVFAIVSLASDRDTARIVSAVVFAMVFASAIVAQLRRPADPPRGELVLGALFLVSPVFNPWYALWILPFAVLRPAAWSWTALAVVSLSYVHGHGLGHPTLGGYEHPAWVRPLEFGAIGVALAHDVLRRVRRRETDDRRTNASHSLVAIGLPPPGDQ